MPVLERRFPRVWGVNITAVIFAVNLLDHIFNNGVWWSIVMLRVVSFRIDTGR
jgi:hypothetical protein